MRAGSDKVGGEIVNKYAIGQDIWIAQCGVTTKYIVCPDCCGKRYLTVIMGDDSKVTVECTGCRHGYNGCDGKIQTYEYGASAEKVTIGGMTIRNGEVEYFFNCTGGSYNTVEEKDVFDSEAAANEVAQAKAKVKEEEERQRLYHRPKDHHGWAFNATYHRSCLKHEEAILAKAQRDIAYHKAQLSQAEEAVERKASR